MAGAKMAGAKMPSTTATVVGTFGRVLGFTVVIPPAGGYVQEFRRTSAREPIRLPPIGNVADVIRSTSFDRAGERLTHEEASLGRPTFSVHSALLPPR
jgi:hypothetical protein